MEQTRDDVKAAQSLLVHVAGSAVGCHHHVVRINGRAHRVGYCSIETKESKASILAALGSPGLGEEKEGVRR